MRCWQKLYKNAGPTSLGGLLALFLAGQVLADGRLAWTGGVTEVEGAAGGGLVPWALIAGLGTADQVGASAFVTAADTPQFSLRAAGVALGIEDRLELSYAHQSFAIGNVVPGATLAQDIVGVKLKLAGDAVFDQDRWWPQLAAGVLYKHARDFESVPQALGAEHASGTDVYLAATKVYLAGLAGRTVLVNVTLRHSDANQYGLLGFGGARAPAWSPEASLGVWLTDTLIGGVEYRSKRGSLAAPGEGAADDAFIAWGPYRNLNFVLAYVDLGPVGFQRAQRGAYVSVSVSY